MPKVQDLLIEIGTEELPPRALTKIGEAFATGICEGLDNSELHHDQVRAFYTPRRLAVAVDGVSVQQPERIVERRGPALQAAFDEEGNPTKAALGFARSCGVEPRDLETLETNKGRWLIFRRRESGRKAQTLLPDIAEKALARLPIPKRMRWGNRQVEFVRPVHWVVFLFGTQLIECELLGIRAGRETRGHRFHHPASMWISTPGEYVTRLKNEGQVLADFAERRKRIERQVEEAARKAGGRAVIDRELLEEVTSLVEWPVAILGRFDSKFLEVPPEALISTMRGHQKYFHVVDAENRLLPYFVTVANLESRNPAAIREGNERVIRPRLADAAFFWEQDRKRPLAARVESLKNVVFQEKLGTLYEKAQRGAQLARRVALAIGGDPELAERAARLAKCDLMTEMVGEFPELQGTMGRYYARHDQEHEEVAQALDEQYLPRFSGDNVAQTETGQALGIADKLDTLVGIFGIEQRPTGDKDPFALRRAALGILRTIIENRLELDLRELLDEAVEQLRERISNHQAAEEVYDFMLERLRGYYFEQGVTSDVFEAVAALRPSSALDFDQRLRAVREFLELSEAASLTAANKRIRNLLHKAEEQVPIQVDTELLRETAERSLHRRLIALTGEVQPLFNTGDYTEGLKRLAHLKDAVDAFFDQVMVMVEEKELRLNRLALLRAMEEQFLQVADMSCLQFGSKNISHD